MSTPNTYNITVETTVDAPAEKVWEFFTAPEHITKWNNPSDEWYTPNAENDLQVGGRFMYRMEARDGSFGFDFGGVYDQIDANRHIAYTLDDERKVTLSFKEEEGKTTLVETFDAETENPIEMQRVGWQNILDSFKNYAEAQSR
jgi:uncharacterized protein YndB with AHSA1/START domain